MAKKKLPPAPGLAEEVACIERVDRIVAKYGPETALRIWLFNKFEADFRRSKDSRNEEQSE